MPLILDLVDNIRKKSMFTKMNLRWGYNNMRIKKRDEWKATFSMLGGSFEFMVILLLHL